MSQEIAAHIYSDHGCANVLNESSSLHMYIRIMDVQTGWNESQRERSGAFALRATDITPFQFEEPNGATLPSARDKIPSQLAQKRTSRDVLDQDCLNFARNLRTSIFGTRMCQRAGMHRYGSLARLHFVPKTFTPFHYEEPNGVTLPSAGEKFHQSWPKTSVAGCIGPGLLEFGKKSPHIYIWNKDVQTGWNASLRKLSTFALRAEDIHSVSLAQWGYRSSIKQSQNSPYGLVTGCSGTDLDQLY
jgi:hypothetical protein